MKSLLTELLAWWVEAQKCKRWKDSDGLCCACVERLYDLIQKFKGK